ncbi:zinc-binding dehydrogenase [Candidatus Poribacteria bacterium]|nr:zinc-binding dehydrogenase [Candidatus Poribacteria bacterium]
MLMKRVIKLEGKGNIAIEEIEIPGITNNEVLVKNKKSLISRGSELFARYVMPGAVDPSIMGYSDAGVVAAVGEDVKYVSVGDRVVAVAPHAEYVVGVPETPDARIIPLPDDVSFEEATFLPLLTSSVAWAQTASIKEGDTVAILGQGLVGSLVMQVSKGYKPGRIIVIDALDLRCEFAGRLGADVVLNCSKVDPVQSVRQLTDGKGADIVIECVGGYAGIKSFEQAQDMVRASGTIHLIALYQGGPLPLHSGKIMGKRLIAGILISEPRSQTGQRAIKHIQDGSVRVKEMITHRFPLTEAKQAFDLLYEHPEEALGVIFEYE